MGVGAGICVDVFAGVAVYEWIWVGECACGMGECVSG